MRESPVVTFRTRWHILKILDDLAQLEGTNRNRIINKAVLQYAKDYLDARGQTISRSLSRQLSMINILQKRIEVKMMLKENRNLEEDRQGMLEETHRYARCTMNQASLLLLMKVSGWLAATLEDPLPADIESRTRELQALLNSLTETHSGN